MTEFDGRRISRARRLQVPVVICSVSAFAAGCGRSAGETERAPTTPDATNSTDPLGYDTPFILAGLQTPPTVAAAAAALPEDARIIGVSLDDQHRAYSVTALSAMSSHVVNDLLNGTAVSVTYCNQTDCARVFTQGQSDSPIDLGVGGWMGGQMSLRYDGQHYPQLSPLLPLEDLPFTTTTWREWRERHPDTDVYTGPLPRTGAGQSLHTRGAAPDTSNQ